MIVGASYEGNDVVLYHDDGSEERIPFTPRLLLPHHLAPHVSSFHTIPAPGGLYVEAPYPTLLRLYSKLSLLSPAIIFPPPERQYLLLNHLRPFTKGVSPDLPSPSSALFHLLLTPSTPNPALTFLENILFLHGYARPLRRISFLPVSTDLYLPFFSFNTDTSTISEEGDILLPTSLVEVRGYHEVRSVHPLLGVIVVKGEGIVTLADALLYDLPHTLVSPRYAKKTPSFLHREVQNLLDLFFNSLHSLPNGLDPSDPTSYHLLLVSHAVLSSLPDLLLNTYALGVKGRNTLVALYNLLRRDPKVYNLLVSEIDTCCPASRELESYLPVLSNLLTEPLRS